ncbi:methyltransferase family protein [Stella humosa]|uniref:Methyltransferase family protein n=1 Tax=Stella humosa TaxID=94 RepID=A0A3N1MFU8_9PROT|nr:class I SAM-dependent methyltransferase [Stella humosa]ROQ00066.1 methyltransferase family protein [Stella humosa]BBK30701.1 methyltransferase type 11 [Stella humosa]
MSRPADGSANWGKASRQWSSVGSPLRPCAEDVAFTEAAIDRQFGQTGRPPAAVLLGVTPELAACRWPAGTRLTAVDNSRAMIDALWPAPGVPDGAAVLCADWRGMPLAAGSIDIAVGDGCFSAAPFPDAGTICREIRRVLRPGGLLSIRLFTRPERPETVDGLREAIAAGTVGNVHALKWRVAALVQPRIEAGARLGDIWDLFQQLAPAIAPFAGQPGWRADELATLDRYRDNDLRFYFPTLEEFRAVSAPWLEEVGRGHGTYPLAERCPTLLLRAN